MERFMGMMPTNEINITKLYTDRYGDGVRIDAGEHGWTVTYVDCSTNYEDADIGAEANFKNAYDCANEAVGPLTEAYEELVYEFCDDEDSETWGEVADYDDYDEDNPISGYFDENDGYEYGD